MKTNVVSPIQLADPAQTDLRQIYRGRPKINCDGRLSWILHQRREARRSGIGRRSLGMFKKRPLTSRFCNIRRGITLRHLDVTRKELRGSALASKPEKTEFLGKNSRHFRPNRREPEPWGGVSRISKQARVRSQTVWLGICNNPELKFRLILGGAVAAPDQAEANTMTHDFSSNPQWSQDQEQTALVVEESKSFAEFDHSMDEQLHA